MVGPERVPQYRPGWRVVVIYATLCICSMEIIKTGGDTINPGLPGTLHQRMVTWSDPSIMQYRWFVPMIAEGIRRVGRMSEGNAYRIVAMLSMWLLLVSFHRLLLRDFTPFAALAGGGLTVVTYAAVHPGIYAHVYDPICAWCIVLAIVALRERSAAGHILAMALLSLVKWQAAAVAVVFLAPAWLADPLISWRSRVQALLGGIAVLVVIVATVHIPLVGTDRFLHPADLTANGIDKPADNYMLVLTEPRSLGMCMMYLLPALVAVPLGYRYVDRSWRALLWYPVGILVCAVAARVFVWELRTYFSAWIVFIPFILAAASPREPGALPRQTDAREATGSPEP
jgi:hypothetical protein